MGDDDLIGRSVVVSRRALAAGSGLGALALAARRPFGPVVRAAQVATPGATPAPVGGVGSYADWLRLVPDPYPAVAASAPLATFADVARQFATVGLTQPDGAEADSLQRWLPATGGLAFPVIFSRAISSAAEWREVFAWDFFQIDQILEFGEDEGQGILVRGRFDVAAVGAALEGNGYRPLDLPGVETAYSLTEEPSDEIDPRIFRLTLGGFTNVALLPDDTFVWSAYRAVVEEVVAVAAGRRPALAGRSEVAALLAAQRTPLASSILLPGIALSGQGDPLAVVLESLGTPIAATGNSLATRSAERDAALAAMPPVRLALLGITPGGPVAGAAGADGTPGPASTDRPEARFRFTLLLGSPEEAERAVAVVADRLATGRSVVSRDAWSEVFAGWDVRAVPERPIVEVELIPGENLGTWRAAVYSADLGFIAW